MKTCKLLLLFLMPFYLFCQNPAYRLCDSILALAETDYAKAKNQLISVSKKHSIDPCQRVNFLMYSYNHKDYSFLKSQVKYLIKQHGFTMQGDKAAFNYYSLFISGELSAWHKRTYHKYYPKWYKKNIDKIETIHAIEELHTQDQMLSKFAEFSIDSSSQASKNIFSMIAREDYDHITKIVELSKKNGGLPNNFDYGPFTYQYIKGILWHNLKTPENFSKAWDLLFPYLEQAYFKGKISSEFLHIYDYFLNQYYGYQYYGFLANVPVKDKESLAERKKHYKL